MHLLEEGRRYEGNLINVVRKGKVEREEVSSYLVSIEILRETR